MNWPFNIKKLTKDSFVIEDHILFELWEKGGFAMEFIEVLDVKKEVGRYNKGCFYALVYCDSSKQYTLIYESDLFGQKWDSPIFKDEGEAKGEFARVTA